MAYDSTVYGYEVDRSYSTVPNIGICDIPFVRSFKIIKHASDSWTLTVNQNKLIGRYPTRAASLGALMGVMKAGGGAEDFAIEAIHSMVNKGRGDIAKAYQTLVLGFGGDYSVKGEVVSSSGDPILATGWDAGSSAANAWGIDGAGGDESKLRLWNGKLLYDRYRSGGDIGLIGSATDVTLNSNRNYQHTGRGADVNDSTEAYYALFSATVTATKRVSLDGGTTWGSSSAIAGTWRLNGSASSISPAAAGSGGSAKYLTANIESDDGTYGLTDALKLTDADASEEFTLTIEITEN